MDKGKERDLVPRETKRCDMTKADFTIEEFHALRAKLRGRSQFRISDLTPVPFGFLSLVLPATFLLVTGYANQISMHFEGILVVDQQPRDQID